LTDFQIFKEGFGDVSGTPLQTNFYIRILELARKSKKSINLIQYVFGISENREWQRSNKFLKALVEAKRRGVEIRVIFDRPRVHAPNTKTNIKCALRLKEFGIETRALAIHKTLHLKMVIFDREIFLAGSHNLTNSSLYSPFELSFEYSGKEIVGAAECYFLRLWNEGISEPFFESVEKMGKARI